MAEACLVGVDLGGTNVRARAYRMDGSEAGEAFALPSRAAEGTRAVVEAIADAIRHAARGVPEPCGVGLAVPGHIDGAAGVVRWAPNFVDESGEVWRDVPLLDLLKERLGISVVIGNDANLAALGEYRFGAGNGKARCLVLITLGTGVGGGVVLSPHAVQGDARGPLLLVGGNQGGAELGHVCLNRDGPDAGAVAYGALESYCSARAIVARGRHKLRYGRPSAVHEIVGDNLDGLTPEALSEAAAKGDEVALEVWQEVGEHLGTALGSFINVFAPDLVAVGGQIAKVGDPLLGPARRAARNVAIPTLFSDANIVRAERVEDAGLLGAAALAMEAHRWTSATAS